MEAEEIGEEDMIPDEETIITITRDGYIKRVPIDTYRSAEARRQGHHRGERQRKRTRSSTCSSRPRTITSSSSPTRGRVYRLKAYEIPQTTRQAMGTAIINLISIEPGDRITATVALSEMDQEGFTGHGDGAWARSRRPTSTMFHNLRANGLRASTSKRATR